MSEPIEPTTHQIPGWDRPAWAVTGVKAGPELIWTRDSLTAVTYQDTGVEETFAPKLVRVDQVALNESGAVVRTGQVVIRFATDATITPGEARKLAEALVELADWADGAR